MEVFEIVSILQQHPEWLPALSEALIIQEKGIVECKDKGYSWIGFEWWQVHCTVPALNKMVTERILDVTLSTRSGTHYSLREPEAMSKAIEVMTTDEPKVKSKEGPLPQDLFGPIVGYEDVKALLKLAIGSSKPCHSLLSGSPASAKTLFLMELSRLPGSYYALAPSMTAAGLADMLLTYTPKFLLIDEIDRLDGVNLGVLASLMATGIVSITKYRSTRQVLLPTKVFAAGIRIHKLPRDILSRFVKLRFPPYTQEQFKDVSIKVCVAEGIEEGIAARIANDIWGTFTEESDVRQVVQVARLSEGDPHKVTAVLRSIKKYRAF